MEFQRRKISSQTIDIAPLVDIVFLLLIFFMISADFIKPIIKLQLPKARTEDTLKKIEIVISANKDGKITINKQEVTLDNFIPALREIMLKKNKADVIFRGDEKLPYKLFVTIMDKARQAGAKSFSIEHEKGY